MIADLIRERLKRDSFKSFRIRASSGKSYLVSQPFLVALMKSEIFIAAANSDRCAQVPYLDIAAVEDVGPNEKKRRKRPS